MKKEWTVSGLDIVKFIAEYYKQHIDDNLCDQMVSYYDEMTRRRRVIIMFDDKDSIYNVTTYYLGWAAAPFYRPDPWSVCDDDPSGDTIYIDKFYGKPPTTEMRRQAQEAFQTLYPRVVKLKYHRPSSKGDRYVIFRSTRYTPQEGGKKDETKVSD